MTPELRAVAVRLCLHAIDGDAGRPPMGDPIYAAIVEGRQAATAKAAARWDALPPAERRGRRPFYSSCGDLPHWMLYRMGWRCSWINRAEHNGWRIGWNIIRLIPRTNPHARKAEPGTFAPLPGDVLHVRGRFDHVRVVLSFDGKTIESADYGQPGAARKRGAFSQRNGRLFSNESAILHWLPLAALPEPEAAPELPEGA